MDVRHQKTTMLLHLCVCGWTLIISEAATSTELVMFTQPTTWNDALAHCVSQGMVLAFLDEDSNAYIESQMNTNTFIDTIGDNFWIGIYDNNEKDASQHDEGYSWASDCQTLDNTWTNWKDGEPQNTYDSLCVVMEKDKPQWLSDKCGEVRPFLCSLTSDQCKGSQCISLTFKDSVVDESKEVTNRPEVECLSSTTSLLTTNTLSTAQALSTQTTESDETTTMAGTTEYTTEMIPSTELTTEHKVPVTSQTITESTETRTSAETKEYTTEMITATNPEPTTESKETKQTTTESEETTTMAWTTEPKTQFASPGEKVTENKVTTQTTTESEETTTMALTTEHTTEMVTAKEIQSDKKVTTKTTTESEEITTKALTTEHTTEMVTAKEIKSDKKVTTKTTTESEETTTMALTTEQTTEIITSTELTTENEITTQATMPRITESKGAAETIPSAESTTIKNVPMTKATTEGESTKQTSAIGDRNTLTTGRSEPKAPGISVEDTATTTMPTWNVNESDSTQTTVVPFVSCFEHCKCVARQVHNETLEQTPEEIRQELNVDRTALSSTRRRKESAPDQRTSSKIIGSGCTFLLLSVLLFVVLADFFVIYKDFRCNTRSTLRTEAQNDIAISLG